MDKKIEFHFNSNFLNADKIENSHVKLSCVLEGKGVFCVIVSIQTKKAIIQTFGDYAEKNVIGFRPGYDHLEDSFYVNAFGSLSDSERECFSIGMGHIERSFKNHVVSSGHSFTVNEQQEIYSELKRISSRYAMEMKSLKDGALRPPVSGEWKPMDDVVNRISPDALNKIVDGFTGGGSGYEMTVDGVRYRIVEDDDGKCVLQYFYGSSKPKENPFDEGKSSPVRSRKSHAMAFMMNAGLLPEFTNGRFYRPAGKGRDGEFITLVSDSGNSRDVLFSRVKLVDVYSEMAKEA